LSARINSFILFISLTCFFFFLRDIRRHRPMIA
jgi:hypothetical protein